MPKSASAGEIKSAFRKLAKKYHPDESKEPRARKLADLPLWSESIPAWWNWESLKAALPSDEGWDVWIEWYAERLRGGSRGEAYELVFASVPPDVLDKRPAAANARIKAPSAAGFARPEPAGPPQIAQAGACRQPCPKGERHPDRSADSQSAQSDPAREAFLRRGIVRLCDRKQGRNSSLIRQHGGIERVSVDVRFGQRQFPERLGALRRVQKPNPAKPSRKRRGVHLTQPSKPDPTLSSLNRLRDKSETLTLGTRAGMSRKGG